MTDTETASVAPEVSGISFSVSQNLITVPPSRSMRDTRGGHAEHPADLTRRDLDPDAGEEADEDGARDEVGEEAEPRDPGEQQQHAADQGGQARETRPTAACPRLEAGDAERRDPRVHDRRRGRVAADDEVARRADQRERDRGGAGSCRGR